MGYEQIFNMMTEADITYYKKDKPQQRPQTTAFQYIKKQT